MQSRNTVATYLFVLQILKRAMCMERLVWIIYNIIKLATFRLGPYKIHGGDRDIWGWIQPRGRKVIITSIYVPTYNFEDYTKLEM